MIDPISLSLTRARMIAGAVVLIALLLAAAAGGALVNGWRLKAGHESALRMKEAAYSALKEKVTEQNAAIAALQGKTEAAEGLRKQAEEHAKEVNRRIADRSAAVGASKATNCDGVLSEAWENWK